MMYMSVEIMQILNFKFFAICLTCFICLIKYEYYLNIFIQCKQALKIIQSDAILNLFFN